MPVEACACDNSSTGHNGRQSLSSRFFSLFFPASAGLQPAFAAAFSTPASLTSTLLSNFLDRHSGFCRPPVWKQARLCRSGRRAPELPWTVSWLGANRKPALTPALPIGSADSADAEREKRSQRLGEVVRRMVQGFNARMFRGNPSPSRPNPHGLAGTAGGRLVPAPGLGALAWLTWLVPLFCCALMTSMRASMVPNNDWMLAFS